MEKITSLEEKRMRFWKQISGDLRTPLNVIKGVSDIWKNEIYDIDSVKAGFSKIEECSSILLGIVNDIVDYTAIENHELEILNENFSLKELVEYLTMEYRRRAEEENKQVDVQVHGVMAETLRGDEHRVHQILECMFKKSLYYSDMEDRLCFHISQTSKTKDKVSLRFILTTSNAHVYEMLCGTVNDKVITENTDIELYNCYYILLKMGGSIYVKREQDTSVIVIDMQFDRSEYEEREQDVSVFANDRILIIADERRDGEEQGALLKEMKLPYDVAEDADEALDMIGEAEHKGTPYRMCIVDWYAKNIALQSFVNDIHNIFGRDFLVVATAYDAAHQMAEAKKIGISYVMEKTWFRSTVFDTLMKLKKGEILTAVEEKVSAARYDFTGKRILVAEDMRLNMEVIVKVLSRVNAVITCADNGVEAVSMFERKPEGYFDCILMDVNMPQMNGYEAARRIRSSKKGDAKSVPIYALTANAFQSDIREALDSGMDGHFAKPIDVDVLYDSLEKLFADRETKVFEERNESGEAEVSLEVLRSAEWYKSMYGTEMYYLEQDDGILLKNKGEYINFILGKNQAVGTISGFYEDGLPMYSISGFALQNLGYDYESFIAATGGKLKNAVYSDDLEYLYSSVNDKDMGTKKIRFIHKNGDIVWFNETHINATIADGRKIWLLSIRLVDDNMAGILCDNYEMVSRIYTNDDMILYEKCKDHIGNVRIHKRTKYIMKNVKTISEMSGSTNVQNIITAVF